ARPERGPRNGRGEGALRAGHGQARRDPCPDLVDQEIGLLAQRPQVARSIDEQAKYPTSARALVAPRGSGRFGAGCRSQSQSTQRGNSREPQRRNPMNFSVALCAFSVFSVLESSATSSHIAAILALHLVGHLPVHSMPVHAITRSATSIA